MIELYALGFLLGAIGTAGAEEAKPAYPVMAHVEQYLAASASAEIALARTAAPPSISGDASVLILGRHGYETAEKGKNGFVCLVWRSDEGPWNWQAVGLAGPRAAKRPRLNFSIKEKPCLSSSPVVSPSR